MGRIRQYIDSLTPERILTLARRNEGLSVSRYRHRDAKVAERVAELVKAGKLRRVQRDRDVVIYRTTDPTRESA